MLTASGAAGKVSDPISSRLRILMVATGHERLVSHMKLPAEKSEPDQSLQATVEAARGPQMTDTRLHRLRIR